MKIYVKNTAETLDVDGGTTLLDLADRISLGFRPLCALVNNKNEGLGYPLYTPKQVEFLPAGSDFARRVYTRSLSMLLYKAVANLYPGTRLRIEHSTRHGYFCRLFNGQEADAGAVEALAAEMRRLVDADIPFVRHEEPTADVLEIFRRQGLNDKVRLLSTIEDLYTVYYSLDGLCDSYYGCLVPSTGYLRRFSLTTYRNGFLLDPEAGGDLCDDSNDPARAKLFKAFTDYLRFNQIIGVRNVGELNLLVGENRSARLINTAEALHVKYITAIADNITQRYDDGGARVVMIAGPSSSGKTTFTKRLAIQLLANELKPCMVSLDDYFVNREATPRDASGDYDFESLYALDLKRFNADLEALLRGETVELPYYNFARGEREYRGDRIRLDDRSVLMIEGIHGLNPELTAAIPRDMKYLVYVSALTTLAIDDHNWVPTTDNRLLRRIVRDFRYRGVDPTETIRRWPSVRHGEEKWIFPYQGNADSMFNSSLLFELAVIKDYADKILARVPRNVPEYAVAARLRTFLSYFRSIEPSAIPPTSLLREFLGGSSFKY